MHRLSYLIFEESGSALAETMALLLPDKEQNRLRRYRFERDFKAAVYAHVLAGCLLGQATGRPYNGLIFGTGEYGKPYLMGQPGVEFNLSHTPGAVVVAVSDSPVGVDVERHRTIDTEIAADICSPAERRLLEKACTVPTDVFFEIWTKKEALLKCLGVGVVEDLTRIDTCVPSDAVALTTLQTGRVTISVCAASKVPERDFIQITEMELLGQWQAYASANLQQ